jgi:hypothetical protein
MKTDKEKVMEKSSETTLSAIFKRSAKFYAYTAKSLLKDYKDCIFNGKGELMSTNGNKTLDRVIMGITSPVVITAFGVVAPIYSVWCAKYGLNEMNAEELEAYVDSAILKDQTKANKRNMNM